MRQIKFGMHILNGDFERARRHTLLAEELGYYSVAMDDHLLPAKTPQDRIPQFECYTMLSWMASITKRVRLVPTVGCMSFRNPALLAKMFTTLDYISGGRIVAGIGAGWLRSEYEAYGYAYPSTAERIERLREGVEDNESDVDAGRAGLSRPLLPYRPGRQSSRNHPEAASPDNDWRHGSEDAKNHSAKKPT